MTRAMKRYLFWQPPSPPRSSEKFLRFHQQQLNHREKRQAVRKRGGRATERESDSPLFSPLHLMATNLIMCLHSEAAETCSLTHMYSPLSRFLCHAYTRTHTRTHRLSLPLLSRSPSPSFALLKCRRGGLWSADVGPDSGGVESSASLFGKWPWMETNSRRKPSHPFYCDTAIPSLVQTHTTPTRSGLAKPFFQPNKKFIEVLVVGCLCRGGGSPQ